MLAYRSRRGAVLVSILLCLLFTRKHLSIGLSLALTPLIFTFGDASMRLSAERDNFDVTFTNYPSYPTPDIAEDPSYQVPPIIHQIFLGPRRVPRPEWDEAREACRKYHPSYTFEMWNDSRAAEFVAKEYPNIWPTWKGYKFVIQRADSLRYMILHTYGGIFLDLDLHCVRPLDPLRKFQFVAPAAHPAGLSNGFMMAKPRLPFMRQLVQNLPVYDLNWFGLPYPTVSFSAGCHYLSAIHATTNQNRTNLRVLWGPRNLHKLSGNVSTPIFHHLGSSSWHSYDAAFFNLIGKPERWRPGMKHMWGHSDLRKWWFLIPLLLLVAIASSLFWGVVRGIRMESLTYHED